MIRPQYILPIHNELVVDLFAGGGGASTGIELALGRHVDIAINHDPEAVSLHQANHPQTRHFVSDVFEVDPVEVCGGLPVGLLWASPDCTFHSKARGGKPHRDRNRARRRRALAWVVVKWAQTVRPRVICLENVEEFQQWGPLLEDGTPCPERRGQSFQRWIAQLRNLGYVVEWKELRACDYGAPTIRKRLFLVARCDGQPIVWPAPTHAKPDARAKVPRGMQPWRTAADCIDWTIPARSIFERKKPLADATCRRIAKGLMRYVVNSPDPFIVGLAHAGQSCRAHDLNEPIRTIHAGGGNHALCVPHVMPMRNAGRPVSGAIDPTHAATAGGAHQELVSAFLAKHYTGVVGSELVDPVSTVTTVDHHSLVAVHLSRQFGKSIGSPIDAPVGTICAGGGGKTSLVTSHLVKMRGTNIGSRTGDPLHTISAQGMHHAEVRAYLIKYYSEGGQDQDCRDPMHTIPTKARMGLVMVKGEPYEIADIGLRMLTPRELYRAQGFPEDYRIGYGAAGESFTQEAQVRMCGNSVCPPVAAALVQANLAEIAIRRAA